MEDPYTDRSIAPIERPSVLSFLSFLFSLLPFLTFDTMLGASP